MTTDLITAEITPRDVFKPNGLDMVISEIEKKKNKFLAETKDIDLTVKKNREKVKSFAHTISRSKTFVDSKGKDHVAKIKVQAKEVDAERKRFRDLMDAWRDEVKAPVVEFELYEQKRQNTIQEKISVMADHHLFHGEPLVDPKNPTSEQVLTRLDIIRAIEITEEEFNEYTDHAIETKADVINILEGMLDSVLTRETEQAELARLREAEEDRKAKEAEAQAEKDRIANEERIKKEAMAKAEQDAKDKIQAEQKAKEDAIREKEEAEQRAIEANERAKRERIEAEQRAEAEKAAAVQKAKDDAAEKTRLEKLAAEKKAAAEKAEADRKAANRNHQKGVNRKALAAIVALGINGLDEDGAKKLLTAIITEDIPAVYIKY